MLLPEIEYQMMSTATMAVRADEIGELPADTQVTAVDIVAEAPVDEFTVPAADETVTEGITEEVLPEEVSEERSLINENALTYTITFDTDGGSEIAPITAEAYAPIAAPDDPFKEGFTFKGWDNEIPASMPENDMIITALWESDHESHVHQAMEECKDISDVKINCVQTTPAPAIPGMISLISADTEKKICDKLLDIDNALIDDLADMLPMGNTLTQPLKWLTGWIKDETEEDQPDPIEELKTDIRVGFSGVNTRIDQLDSKIDDLHYELNSATNKISTQVTNMSERAELNAEWVRAMNDNSNRLTKCTGYLDELNAKATGISGMYYRIAGIESDSERTAYEKLVDIAALSSDPTMTGLTEKLDILSNSLYEKTSALNTNFFEAIALYNYKDVMFSKEAYVKNRENADTVVEQYLISAMIYLRTLEAEKRIASFTEEELMQLSDEYIDIWAQVRKQGGSTITMRYERVEQDIEKVLTGYMDFIERTNSENTYVDHGRVNYSLQWDTVSLGSLSSYNRNLKDQKCLDRGKLEEVARECANIYSGKDVLGIEDMKRLVDYINTNYPGMSIEAFAKEMGLIEKEKNCYDTYILSDATPNITIEKNRKPYLVYHLADLNLKTINVRYNFLQPKDELVYYVHLAMDGSIISMNGCDDMEFLVLRMQ